MRRLNCLRCGNELSFLMQEKFQKGDMGVWVGNLNFSMQGGFEMEVYVCKACGKLEFYHPELPAENVEIPEIREGDVIPPDGNIVCVNREGIPQVRCPRCLKLHDFDYPNCPYCG